MKRLNVYEGEEQSLNIPRSLFARWLLDSARITDVLPDDEPVLVVPRLETPATKAPVWELWKHSRE